MNKPKVRKVGEKLRFGRVIEIWKIEGNGLVRYGDSINDAYRQWSLCVQSAPTTEELIERGWLKPLNVDWKNSPFAMEDSLSSLQDLKITFTEPKKSIWRRLQFWKP